MDIIFIKNYNGIFSSKWAAKPYRSGMDQKVLGENLSRLGHSCQFINYTDIDFRKLDGLKGKAVFYTSSEDEDLFYKSYVEDMIYGLELSGIHVVPGYKYLRAHHNKNFMEILRDLSQNPGVKNIRSSYFGTLEDFNRQKKENQYPLVLKSAFGATGKTVTLLKDSEDATKKVKKFSRSFNLKFELWDRMRALKHKGYIKESKFRRKFITQNLIAGMDRDWKVLVFGEKFYVLERKTRKNDFRASGSGLISYTKNLPQGMLDYAKRFSDEQNLPFIGMDVAYNGKEFSLIEFQALYFGTHTLDTSPYFFQKNGEGNWECIEKTSILEVEVAEAIHVYINKQF
jgi:glutathione synthase/RimK-type ligase-like ATP-grasp enzyme